MDHAQLLAVQNVPQVLIYLDAVNVYGLVPVKPDFILLLDSQGQISFACRGFQHRIDHTPVNSRQHPINQGFRSRVKFRLLGILCDFDNIHSYHFLFLLHLTVCSNLGSKLSS